MTYELCRINGYDEDIPVITEKRAMSILRFLKKQDFDNIKKQDLVLIEESLELLEEFYNYYGIQTL